MKSKLTEVVSFRASNSLVKKLDDCSRIYNEPRERIVTALMVIGLGVYLQDNNTLKGMLGKLDSIDNI